MKSVFSILASVCLFVLARAAVLMGASAYLAPPDFGSELPWEQMNISLVRVLSVEDGEVVLRTERSYTGRKDVPDESVPLSQVSFGYERRPGSRNPVKKPVHVAAGDELVVWPVRAQPFPLVDGTKVAGAAESFPLVKTLEEIAKIREAGSEAALKGGVSSADATVLRYALSRLEKTPIKASDQAFADKLRALRADTTRPMPIRLSANRLLPRFAAAPEQASAEAAQWPRTLFMEAKDAGAQDLRWLATGIISTFPKREDRVRYFVAILRDEDKPRPVREASLEAAKNRDCFDYDHPAAETSSEVFTAVLALLKSKDGEIRKDATTWLEHVCDTIDSRKGRAARAKEAITSLDAAVGQEQDKGIRKLMEFYRDALDDILTDRWHEEDLPE